MDQLASILYETTGRVARSLLERAGFKEAVCERDEQFGDPSF